MYQKNIENGYIISLVKGVTNSNITEEEYNTLLEVIQNKPTALDGYDYKLREDLIWELYEPPIPEPEDEETIEEEYQEVSNSYM